MTEHQWLLFFPAAALVAASPGAGNFLALTHGLRSGLGPAVIALIGRFAAFSIMILLVMIGVGALLAASAVAFTVLKWAGVAYLLWLGLRLWRSEALPVEADADLTQRSWHHLVVREFTVAATNPKAVLLFTAFLPQFVAPGRPMAGQFIMLGGAYMLIECVAASGYALRRQPPQSAPPHPAGDSARQSDHRRHHDRRRRMARHNEARGVASTDGRSLTSRRLQGAHRRQSTGRSTMAQTVNWGILSTAKIGREKVIPAMQKGSVSRVLGDRLARPGGGRANGDRAWASTAPMAATRRCSPTPISTPSTIRCPTICMCPGASTRWKLASMCCARSRSR